MRILFATYGSRGDVQPLLALRFVSFLRRELLLQFNRLEQAIEGADMALGASLAFALATVAERRRVPYRFIAFTPQLIPSGAHPFMAFQTQGFPAWWNRSTWRIVSLVDRFNLTRLINSYRRQHGLPPIQDAWGHILGPELIVASDRAMSEIPPDAT